MNLINIYTRFPDQQACLEHLEFLRWGHEPHCPHCGSASVGRKADGVRMGRFNCHDCKSSFNVLSGTIFEKTKLPLQKWFLAVGLIVNAKRSLSSHQLARDLELNQKSAWYMQQRIRAQMASEKWPLLQGIFESNETYVCSKPRKEDSVSDRQSAKKRHKAKKIKVLRIMERGGRVAVQVSDRLNCKDFLRFIRRVVDPLRSLLFSDGYVAFNSVQSVTARAVFNHSVAYVYSDVCTDSIEGFRALIKQAQYGRHHHYKVQYAPVFIADSVWRYVKLCNPYAFSCLLKRCFQ